MLILFVYIILHTHTNQAESILLQASCRPAASRRAGCRRAAAGSASASSNNNNYY